MYFLIFQVRVFAGVEETRLGPKPVATGRLCEWKEDPAEPADKFSSFGAYQRSLNLQCQEGQPGIIQWTPDSRTPDLVYYQCFTHRYSIQNLSVDLKCTVDIQPNVIV